MGLALFLKTAPEVPLVDYPFFTNVDSEATTLMSRALQLESDSDYLVNLNFDNGADAPEGGYMCWLYGTSPTVPVRRDTLACTVPLPSTLSANTYYIFLYGICYDNAQTVDVTMGGATSDPITLSDRDANGYWADRITITTTGNATSFDLTLHRNMSGQSDQKYLWRGAYITTNANYTMTERSLAVNLTYPTVMDDSAAVKGNLIPNGSFETGVDGWGWVGEGGGQVIPLGMLWDNTQGHSGGACLRISNPVANRLQPGNNEQTLISPVYHVAANKVHSLSLWVKKETGTTTGVTAYIKNTFVPPSGYHAQFVLAADILDAGTSWTKISIPEEYLVAYPTADFQIYLKCNITADAVLLITDIQLEEGDETSFAPAASLEAGVVIDMETVPGNIFWDTDDIEATLYVHNSELWLQEGTLHFEVYDVMNRVVDSGTVALSVASGTTHSETFSLDVGKLGAFRLVTWIEGVNRSERELAYSVIPEPATLLTDTTSNMGCHPNYTDFQLSKLQRMGVKYIRDLSPAAYGRWDIIEPVEGSYVFFDTEVARALSYGMTPMCVLGANNFWPAWAATTPFFDLTKWSNFCSAMATHYSPSIKIWEIWNEPTVFMNTLAQIDFYAQMIRVAADAILAADPTATIVGCGGLSLFYMDLVIRSLERQYPDWVWQDHVPVMATHFYPGGSPPESFVEPVIEGKGVEVWNTETGVWDIGYMARNFVAWGRPVYPHINGSKFYTGLIGAACAVAENYAVTVAHGLGKYFQYDTRYYAAPNYFEEHTSLFDYDGTLKPKGVVYAILGSFIDHAIGMGNVAPNNDLFLVFDTGGTNPFAVLIASDRLPATLTPLGLVDSDFEVLDLMGNNISITGTDIPYGRVPVYVRGLGITAAAFKTAIESGTVASREDTTAPNLVIVDAPRGAITTGAFRARWAAVDDTSYPNLGEINSESHVLNDDPDPNAIVYSHQLNPVEGWSAWTAEVYADYSGLSSGSYTFSVRARDKAGNIGTASRTIVVS